MTFDTCQTLCDAYNMEEARLNTGRDWYPSHDGFGWDPKCIECDDEDAFMDDDDSFDALDLSEIL